MKRNIGRQLLAMGLIAGASLLGTGSAVAVANTSSTYAPANDSRTFTNSSGGWTGSNTSAGLCVPVLLCPGVSMTYQPSGGAGGAGDGYLSTKQASLLGAASESDAIWTGPSFRYNGATGAVADQLRLTLAMKANVAEFLAVTGNSADYSVQVLAGSSGNTVAVEPVTRRAIVDRDQFVAIPPVSLNPRSLKIGSTYRLRIVTRFVGGVVVLPAVEADYDNVGLRAVDVTSGNGKNGSNGKDGKDGKNGKQGLTTHEVRTIVSRGIPRSATMVGRRVYVKLRCPGRSYRRCRFSVVGLVRPGRGRTTFPRFARIYHGKAKNVGLVVKARSRKRFQTAPAALFRIRVRTLGHATVYYKRLHLKHRR